MMGSVPAKNDVFTGWIFSSLLGIHDNDTDVWIGAHSDISTAYLLVSWCTF
ncbi:MAG: hypothetical protein KTR29_17465 [Rhodothermaceae bacterium]|nr:hypothetical protein [Rhodothermaceae bacterium]